MTAPFVGKGDWSLLGKKHLFSISFISCQSQNCQVLQPKKMFDVATLDESLTYVHSNLNLHTASVLSISALVTNLVRDGTSASILWNQS